jgi:hypothetical protein
LTSYLRQPPHPRILTLDCTHEVVESIRQAGYDVEAGATGLFEGIPMRLPAALHEKDLIIVDRAPGWTPRQHRDLFPDGPIPTPEHACRPRGGAYPLSGFEPAFERGALVVCLLEERIHRGTADSLARFGWLAGSKATTGGLSQDTYLRLTPQAERIPPLSKLLTDHADQLAGARVIKNMAGAVPWLVNDAEDWKAAFELRGSGGFLYLPFFRRKTTAIRRLLREVLPAISPKLFPPRVETWSEKDEYQFFGVLEVRARRAELERAHAERLAGLEREESAAKAEQRPFVELLEADSHDLRKVVHRVLTWLEFEEVVDEDARREAAGIKQREEDLQLRDGDFFAVVEVTSGRGNAREKDFLDLQKYRYRRQQDPGRDDIDPLAIRGLLVMNQHTAMEPAARPDLYEGNPNDYPQEAVELEVELLSTWELFRIVRGVAAATLTREQARELIKQPGLIRAPEGS